MSILRDLSYARPRSAYVPLDIGAIDAAGAALEEQYNANKDKASLVLGQLNNMKVRDVNTPILENVRKKAQERIDALATRGDYENSALELNNLANELNQDPLLQGALTDYKTYQDYLKSLEELKDVPNDRKQMATTYSNATNNAMVEYDPITGYKNVFQGYKPVNVPNFEETVGKFVDKIKASSGPMELGKDANGNPVYMGKANNGYYIVGDKEGIGEQEAMGIISGYIASNPEFQGYFKENLMFDKFNRKYNPQTGQYDQFNFQDFGDPTELQNKLKEAGLDPSTLNDPAVLENIYDRAYLESQVANIADPYAQATSYTKTKFDYKQDNEWLNKQKSDLALRNALKKLAAEEASQKRIIDYKAQKEEEKEARDQAKLILSNPVEAEPVNLEIAEKSLDRVESDLKLLTAKKEASMKGATDSNGAPITFSPEEEAKLVQLTNDKNLLQHEKDSYMKNSVLSLEGQRLIKVTYDKFVEKSGNPENISLTEFTRRIEQNDIKEPKRKDVTNFLGMKTGKTDDDLSDVNSWLKTAKYALGKSEEVQKDVNKILTNEANGFFAADENSKSDKASTVSKVKRTLAMNVLNQGGVGYDVVGSSQRLNDILQGQLVVDGENTQYKGAPVDVEVVPLDREQKGGTDQDIMYQMIIRKKSGELIKSMRIRPQDQESHSNMNYEMNKSLAESYGADTKIGRYARRAIINYELPQFKVAETKKLLDAQVNETTPKGVMGVGSVVNLGSSNWVFVKNVDNVVDHFDGDDPSRPVTLQQPGYHLVRLKNNTPSDVIINQNNLDKYLYDPKVGVFGNAILNERNISNDNLKKYAIKNRNAATHFGSIEDALSILHSQINTK